MEMNAKLTPYEVNLIREMWDAKVWDGYEVTQKLLAECFFVSRQSINEIVNKKKWRNLPCH